MRQEVLDRLRKALDDAASDVEADNPEAEAGWEWDVFASVLSMEEGTEEEKDEVWRWNFGDNRRPRF